MSVIRSNLKRLLADREIKLSELSRRTGISYQGLHKLYSGETKGVSFETLDRICSELHCQVNKIIEYVPDE